MFSFLIYSSKHCSLVSALAVLLKELIEFPSVFLIPEHFLIFSVLSGALWQLTLSWRSFLACFFFLLSLSFGSSRPLPFFFRFLSWPFFLQKTSKDWCFLVFPSQNSLLTAHRHPPLQLSPAANPHHTPTSSRPVCSTVGCLFGHIILPTGHWIHQAPHTQRA